MAGAAEELAAAHGVTVVAVGGDLSDETVAGRLADTTRARLGPADLLVNNAGGGVILPFLQHTATTLKATVDRNLWTVLWCTRAFLPDMIARRYGRVVNIGRRLGAQRPGRPRCIQRRQAACMA